MTTCGICICVGLEYIHQNLLIDLLVVLPPSEGLPIPGGNGDGALYDVELYDIDYSYPASVVADLKRKGKKVRNWDGHRFTLSRSRLA